MTLTKQTVQRRSCEQRYRGLQRIEAVIEWQKRVTAEGNTGRFLLDRQHRGSNIFRAHACIRHEPTLLPLLRRRWADAVTCGKNPHALLATLDRETSCLRRSEANVQKLAQSSSLQIGRSFVSPHSGTEHLLADLSDTAHLMQMFDSTIVRAHVSAVGEKGGRKTRRSAGRVAAFRQKYT